MKRIIVTGASKGLGFAISERLISIGPEVIGISRDTSTLDFPSFDCDVQSYDSIKKIAKKLKIDYKRIDVLINSAGIASLNLALMTPEKVSKRIINTNLLGTIFSCQNFGPLIIKNKKGFIINFSTIAVALGLRGESIYCASKAGVEAFSKSFAKEMSDFNINVNCIAPGPIKTSLLKGVTEKQISDIVNNQVIKKLFSKEDISDLVEILISDKFSSISGQILHVGGV